MSIVLLPYTLNYNRPFGKCVKVVANNYMLLCLEQYIWGSQNGPMFAFLIACLVSGFVKNEVQVETMLLRIFLFSFITKTCLFIKISCGGSLKPVRICQMPIVENLSFLYVVLAGAT
jgi:hypothetical protein